MQRIRKKWMVYGHSTFYWFVRNHAEYKEEMDGLWAQYVLLVCERSCRGLSDVISSHGVKTCRTREWSI